MIGIISVTFSSKILSLPLHPSVLYLLAVPVFAQA